MSGRSGLPERLVIGVWQGQCADGDLEANLARAARVIDEAKAQGCDFVCLPETFLSGYGSRGIIERGAMALDDPRLVGLARQAGDRGVVALVGMTERRGEAMANTQVILDGGRVAGSYSKTMLTDGDAKEMGFRPGDTLPVFRARGVCYGIIICADSSFPEVASTMVWKGARIIFSPHYNMIPAQGMDDHRVRVRNNHVGIAAHFGVVVARSNVVVTEDPEGRLGYGDSAIFSPSGAPIVEAGLFTEGLVSADVGPCLRESRWTRRDRLRVAIVEQWAAAARQALGG